MRLLCALALLVSCVSTAAAREVVPTAAPGGLQAAIDQARPGDVIHLPAGAWEGPLVIEGGELTLRGDGAGQTLLHRARPSRSGELGDALITVRGGGRLVLDGLSLEAGAAAVGVRVEAPPAGAAPRGIGAPGAYTSFQLSLINGCLTGANLPGSVGLLVDGTGGPVSVLVQNMFIENWDRGIRTLGPAAYVRAQDSALTPNLTAAFDNSAGGGPQDAGLNWWGSASGPGGAGPGTGSAVLGAGVIFTPWRLNGVDGVPGCGFNPVPDNVVTPGPADTCLSTAHPCVTIPVTVARTDNGPLRGFSVTFQLSPELALCAGPGSVSEGGYLSGVNPLTNLQVVDNGGGSWTVDAALLGLPCGATAPAGTLFRVALKALVPAGTGTLTITSVLFRDCDNSPLPATPGPALSVPIDAVATGPVTGLAATQVKSGNDGDGTTKITLSFVPPPGAAAVRVYRAPFGNYPEYDDAPGAGAVPAPPAYPPGPPWSLTAVTASGQSDEPATRDFWYYVAFAVDGCGNVSAVSNRTGGTLNYHLGDTHNGVADCQGDNRVNTADLSFLGAHYGSALGPSDPLGCLDFGPTQDFGVDTRPTTDNVLDFEDLILLALNYAAVSKTTAATPPAEGVDEIALELPAEARADGGGDFEVIVRWQGAGDAQAVSVDLAYDAARVRPISVAGGELLARQSRGAAVLSAGPGNVDVALLGDGPGLSGGGELARVRFQRLAAGPAGVSLARVRARDRLNRPIQPGEAAGGAPTAALPEAAGLGAARPNPFQGATVISFTLRTAGPARIDIFDLQGRRVRALRGGEAPAGRGSVTWDGRTDAGLPAASGLYFVRLDTGRATFSRSIRLVR